MGSHSAERSAAAQARVHPTTSPANRKWLAAGPDFCLAGVRRELGGHQRNWPNCRSDRRRRDTPIPRSRSAGEFPGPFGFGAARHDRAVESLERHAGQLGRSGPHRREREPLPGRRRRGAEALRYGAFVQAFFDIAENYHRQIHEHKIERNLAVLEAIVARRLSIGGFADWWKENTCDYDPAFVGWVESVRASAIGPSRSG